MLAVIWGVNVYINNGAKHFTAFPEVRRVFHASLQKRGSNTVKEYFEDQPHLDSVAERFVDAVEEQQPI